MFFGYFFIWVPIFDPTLVQYFIQIPHIIFLFWNKGRAWRDNCFPEPFSWFSRETGLKSLKITSARCFLFYYFFYSCCSLVRAKNHQNFLFQTNVLIAFLDLSAWTHKVLKMVFIPHLISAVACSWLWWRSLSCHRISHHGRQSRSNWHRPSPCLSFSRREP